MEEGNRSGGTACSLSVRAAWLFDNRIWKQALFEIGYVSQFRPMPEQSPLQPPKHSRIIVPERASRVQY
jgi:hypothetical protein